MSDLQAAEQRAADAERQMVEMRGRMREAAVLLGKTSIGATAEDLASKFWQALTLLEGFPEAGQMVLARPRPEVSLFADAMEKRLRENDHKAGWDNCTNEWLLLRLVEEVGELVHALDGSFKGWARSECADVANYAMMVWDRLRRGRVG